MNPGMPRLERQKYAPWDDAHDWWPALTAATHDLDAPVGVISGIVTILGALAVLPVKGVR